MARSSQAGAAPEVERLLVDAAEQNPALSLGQVEESGERAASTFAERFPGRHARLPPRAPEVIDWARERSRGGAPAFLRASVRFLLGEAFPSIVRELAAPRANVKLLASASAAAPGHRREGEPARSDLATMRAVPSMTVLAPSDAPSLRAAVGALAGRDGTAYVRLPPANAPAVTTGAFVIGRAEELRAGSDLTVISYGPALAPALTVADELARVGVSVRVLDAASLKPIDEGAILRAARETGAILVVEAAPMAGGVGTYVAAITAENRPVPVRRVGWTDVAEPDGPEGTAGDPELSVERLRDEAWELLRWRGKVQ